MGWGGDVNVRCEVHMDVEATRYDAVLLSWKLMLRYSTVGWGEDVNVRCEVHMDVDATRYDAVQLSWKLRLGYSTMGWGRVGWGC